MELLTRLRGQLDAVVHAMNARRSSGLSVRSKSLLMLLATSLLSLGTITWLAYQSGKAALTEAATNQLTSYRASKKQQVEQYFTTMRTSFRAVAEAPGVAAALKDLTAGFRTLGQAPLAEGRLKALERYYAEEYLPRLNKHREHPATLDDAMPVASAAQEVQALFLSENPQKYGEKQLLTRHGIDNAYTLAHARHHRWLASVTRYMRYYDIFLIDAETSQIVYTVSKETDLGQSIRIGRLVGSSLAQLVRDVMQTRQQGEVRMHDFAFYEPSHNEPAGFMATPVFDGETFIGVIAAQISTTALDAMINNSHKWRENGLGSTGAAYIVGRDRLMRTNYRFMIEQPDAFLAQVGRSNVVSPATLERMRHQGTTILHYPHRDAPPIARALEGRTGTELFVNQRGVGAFLSYAPLDLPDLDWAIITRIDQNEILAAQVRFNRNVMIAACTLVLLATLIGLWLARIFTAPITALLTGIEHIRRGDRGVVVESRSTDEFNDLVGAFNSMSETIRQRDELIEARAQAYEQLLKRIFPDAVADRMKLGEATAAESFGYVTVVYAVIDGFAVLADRIGGDKAAVLLSEIVDRFDVVAEQQGVEKVKTIGDHYLAVSGLSVTRLDHARRSVDFMRLAYRELTVVNQMHGLDLGLRAGIATGSAQAGLVGSRRFVYDIWGPATSMARRIVYEADHNSVRLNDTAASLLHDRTGIGEERSLETRTLGRITIWQLRLRADDAQHAAE